ncbi:MAG: hypothetical protein AMXMBFR12_07200 [Candidatus Babeliales bacterium]
MPPQDLIMASKSLYESSGLLLHDYAVEKEGQEYNAASFKLNNYRIVFRVAKITPTKAGQFVTIWKRIENGPIMPFDTTDSVDFFIIGIRENDQGQFIFPKQILVAQNYISRDGKGGKRAMRVYPPWTQVTSPQAQKTRDWQIPYYFEISTNNQEQIKRLSALFHLSTNA